MGRTAHDSLGPGGGLPGLLIEPCPPAGGTPSAWSRGACWEGAGGEGTRGRSCSHLAQTPPPGDLPGDGLSLSLSRVQLKIRGSLPASRHLQMAGAGQEQRTLPPGPAQPLGGETLQSLPVGAISDGAGHSTKIPGKSIIGQSWPSVCRLPGEASAAWNLSLSLPPPSPPPPAPLLLGTSPACPSCLFSPRAWLSLGVHRLPGPGPAPRLAPPPAAPGWGSLCAGHSALGDQQLGSRLASPLLSEAGSPSPVSLLLPAFLFIL